MAALLVLALAGVLMSAAARRSSAAALEAGAELERLRCRWGALSLQRALLPRVEENLRVAETQGDPGAPGLAQARQRVALAGMDFELVFGDEQAKANVNTLLARKGLDGAVRGVRELLAEARAEIAVDLCPGPEAPALGSFGQLFAGPYVDKLHAAGGDELPAAAMLTCWGDGRINFRRCSAAALKVATDGVLSVGQQQRLLSLRTDVPGLSLAEVLRRLDVDEARRPAVAAALTDTSACHSLWIIARTPQRRWYRLAVTCPRPAASGLSRTRPPVGGPVAGSIGDSDAAGPASETNVLIYVW